MPTPFNGYVDHASSTTISGWAWDSRKPNDPVVVNICSNGQPIVTVVADRFRDDLLAAGFGSGRHSFLVELPARTGDANVRVLSATIDGSDFELNRSPFPCGPAEPASTTQAAAADLDRLRAEIERFSRTWHPHDHHANRLASLSARDGGVPTLSARPQWFMIETTSHCNLKCVMCPHGHDAMPNKSDLDTSRFSKSFDFLALADRMQLFGTGEPLMSAAFWQILDSMDQDTETEVSINTNGTLLTPERIDRLLCSPLSWISISLDAATPQTYRRIRGADFDLVLSRVKKLVAARNARPSSRRLRIFINMTLMRANIGEFPQFVELAAALGVDGVQVNQLLWHQEHCTWEIQKGDWKFVYRDELLRTSVESSNECIEQALATSAALNIPIFFDGSQFEGSALIVQEPA